MPKKLDDCVTAVKKQLMESGKSEKEASSGAYAICSKSTGYVKTGAHTWKKKPGTKELKIDKKDIAKKTKEYLKKK